MKMSLLPLLIFGLHFYLLIKKVSTNTDDKYDLEERLFLDQFFTSDLIGDSRIPEPRLLNKPKAIYLEGTLHSFENIGITKESIRDFVGVKRYEDLALDLDSKKIDLSPSKNFELSIVNYDTIKISDNNSFYRISRVSFNHSYTEALVAIEFVCFDCGHLSLYKFIRRKNRDWKRKKLINLWIS